MKGCTCRHTRVSIRVAERPSLSAGALVSCVARLTELGAALLRLHGAQRLVCMSETEKEAWSSHTDITWKKNKKTGQTTVASASHLFRSGCPRSPTCRRSRSLPRCRNTCRRSCRACLHTGLHLNAKEARRWKGVSTRTCRVYFKPSTYQHRRPRRDPARQDMQSHPPMWRRCGDANSKTEEQLTVWYESGKKRLACSYVHTFSMQTCSMVEPAALRFWRCMSEFACCLSKNTARSESIRCLIHNKMKYRRSNRLQAIYRDYKIRTWGIDNIMLLIDIL